MKRRGLMLVLMVLLAPVHGWAQAPILRDPGIFHPVVATKGMVATQHRLASEVGARILSQGGNAVDAAVAVGFSLAVVLPRAGNLGGGGFMLLHLAEDNKTLAIDYREMAPAAAHRDMFLDQSGQVDSDKSRFSHAAAGVPGTVAGLIYVQEQYGLLSLQQVLQPAIEQAEQGFAVTHDLSSKLQAYKHLKNNPATRAAYFKQGGEAYQAGEILRQSDLAWSLKQIQMQGGEAFYQGAIAERLVAEMQRAGGLITAEDLANYKVVVRDVVRGDYRGYGIASMPPPSSGGVHLVQMLNVLEQAPLGQYGYGSADAMHWMAETMKRAYADRSKHLGDPDFVPVPVAQLTSKDYGRYLFGQIDGERATPANEVHPAEHFDHESRDTTHYSIMDAEGNAVANTYTLNFSFGSGITVPGTGILLNNEMDDFSAKPGVPNAYGLLGAEANRIEGGKRPLSSMTPTIVFKGDKPWLVTGSPGGSRIITTTLQAIVNTIDHKMNVAAAVSVPRFHNQWLPDKVFVEPGFSPDTVKLLELRGHGVKQVRGMGSAQSIMWEDGVFYGAADPRKPDAAAVGL
ncbi:MAG: gamma-glutamyltransferase [Candidatus Pelagadaptatus aseana]|uniref:gamma-glutamyltransferase n=1 Tax=Candidatus Pelagadaptatus aseana TaxID=3120508 RepID=UPI0039B159F6